MKMHELVMSDYSKAHAMEVAAKACASPGAFRRLVDCFVSEDVELSKRAAWSIGWAVKQRPEMVFPHLDKIIAMLETKGRHPSIVRNAVRVLEDLALPEKYHGVVMDACFRLVESHTSAPAVKAFSLTVLHRLSAIYPDIRPELRLVIEENFENESPAFRSRGRKILQDLQRPLSHQ